MKCRALQKGMMLLVMVLVCVSVCLFARQRGPLSQNLLFIVIKWLIFLGALRASSALRCEEGCLGLLV